MSPIIWTLEANSIGSFDVVSRMYGKQQYVVADDLPIEDARLIASAPDLYDALEQAVEALNSYSDVVDGSYGDPMPNTAMKAVLVCEAALGKARGEKDLYSR